MRKLRRKEFAMTMEENKNLYRNPFKAPEPGSTGDPFVMRYDADY